MLIVVSVPNFIEKILLTVGLTFLKGYLVNYIDDLDVIWLGYKASLFYKLHSLIASVNVI